MKARIIFHGVAVLLLLAAVAVAQDKAKQAPAAQSSDQESSASSASGREASSGMATGRKSGSIHAADFKRTETTARESGSGMATGRMAKPSQTESDGSSSDKSSAHATESLNARRNGSGPLESAISVEREPGNKSAPRIEGKRKADRRIALQRCCRIQGRRRRNHADSTGEQEDELARVVGGDDAGLY